MTHGRKRGVHQRKRDILSSTYIIVKQKRNSFNHNSSKNASILPGRGGTADIHAAHSVPPTRSSQEHFRGIQFPLGILEFCPLCEVELPAPLHWSIPSPYRTPATSNSTPGTEAWCPCGSGWYRPSLQIGQEGIGRFRGQEGKLGSNTAWAGGATEQATQLPHWKAIHCQLQEMTGECGQYRFN